jgi:hypothetical protein
MGVVSKLYDDTEFSCEKQSTIKEYLLHDRLGYHDLEVNPKVYMAALLRGVMDDRVVNYVNMKM